MNKSKILVIGLDGATWDLLKPLAENGQLPTLGKLIKEGACGNLKSIVPPVSGPAWVSFATGKNPGKHGIFDFVKFNDRSYTQEQKVISSEDIGAETYYETLSENGLKSILINLPVSYPPKEINGVIVTSILTQDERKMVYPPEIRHKYSSLFENYKIIPEINEEVLELIDKTGEVERNRFRLAKELFIRERWDNFFVMFSGIDLISHYAFGYFAEENDISKAFLYFLKEIDDYISWFLNNIDEETFIIITSDHGFAKANTLFYINKWLYINNYISTKVGGNKENPFFKNIEKIGKLDTPKSKVIKNDLFAKIIGIIREYGLFSSLFNKVNRTLQSRFNFYVTTNRLEIDIAKSKAFTTTMDSYGIYINSSKLNGGIVDESEYEELRSEIISKLKNIGVDNKKIIKDAWRREEIYSGPYVDSAPDVVFLPDEILCDTTLIGNKNEFLENISKNGQGWHDMDGIFLAHGNSIKRGIEINANIVDITPTILHLFNLPIPKSADGRVLKEIFEDGSELSKREVIYQSDEEGKVGKKIRKTKPFSREDEERVKERLRGLGYL